MKILLSIFVLLVATTTALTADGDLDTTFGAAGRVFATGSTSDFTERIALQPDGKLIVTGYTSAARNVFDYSCMMVRFNSDGSADTSYGTNGRVAVRPTNETCQLLDVAVQPDGKAVGVGLMGNQLVVMRFTASGQLDTTFNTTGFNNQFAAFGNSIEVEPTTGKIVVGGATVSFTGGTRYNFAMWRFNPDGSTDTTFDGDGETSTAIGIASIGNPEGVTDLKILADGRYVGVGTTAVTGNSRNLTVVRYLNSGALDTSLGGLGYTVKVLSSGNSTGESLAVQADGKIVTVGFSTTASRMIARLNSDGSMDTSFADNGFAFSPNGSPFFEIALQADGKIVTAGRFFVTGQNYNFYVIRLTTSGAVDPTFGTGGVVNTNFSTTNRDESRSILVQPDGRIVVAGPSFTEGSNTNPYVIAIARYVSAPPVAPNAALRVSDFDGDGKSDVAVYRTGTWFVNPSASASGFTGVNFGLSSDQLTAADFDGDGRTDVAVWRQSESNFYILNSSNGAVRVDNFGLPGDIPLAGDFDGDGRADVATYRAGPQSYFFYRGSLNNPAGNTTFVPWGTTGDQPVRGDFDGDGKLDPAVFRPSTAQWIILQSGDQTARYVTFGLAGDRRVTADYDGDRKSDPAVYRDGVWYILQSSNGQVRYANWGLSADLPVPADYDGDGRADIAVFRNGIHYIVESSTGATVYRSFGAAGDNPVAASVNP